MTILHSPRFAGVAYKNWCGENYIYHDRYNYYYARNYCGMLSRARTKTGKNTGKKYSDHICTIIHSKSYEIYFLRTQSWTEKQRKEVLAKSTKDKLGKAMLLISSFTLWIDGAMNHDGFTSGLLMIIGGLGAMVYGLFLVGDKGE